MAKSGSWQARNARAQALGYRNYYDYRVHNYGKQPASAPVSEAARPRLRGHRGAADLEQLMQRGRVELLTIDTAVRGKQGRYTSVQVSVLTTDGKLRTFTLRGKGATNARLAAIRDAAVQGGATYLAAASVDVFAREGKDVDAGSDDEITLEREDLEDLGDE